MAKWQSMPQCLPNFLAVPAGSCLGTSCPPLEVVDLLQETLTWDVVAGLLVLFVSDAYPGGWCLRALSSPPTHVVCGLPGGERQD